MKYKIYQTLQVDSNKNSEFYSDQLQLIIFLNEVLHEEARRSLEKLLVASRFKTSDHYQIVNIQDVEIVNTIPIYMENNIKWIWIFGASSIQFNLPDSVPLNRVFYLLDKQWMLWPAYSKLIKSDQNKRLLWNEIKLMLDNQI